MSTQTQPQLKYLTRCRVPGCGQEFAKSPLEIPIIGQPNKAVIEFVGALANHCQKKHPEIMARISGSVQEVLGYLVIGCFEMQDPKLNALAETVRAKLYRITRRTFVSNEEIQDRVARLGLDAKDEEGVSFLIRDLRDVLLEEGQYAPKSGQAETPLVTP